MILREIKNYAKIKLTSTWLEGENYYYGLKLGDKNGDFYAFEIKPDGKACFIKKINGKNNVYVDNIATGCATYGKAPVEQTVIIKGDIIEYYVNDKLVHVEKSVRLSIIAIGLRHCGRQKVAYDKLEINDIKASLPFIDKIKQKNQRNLIIILLILSLIAGIVLYYLYIIPLKSKNDFKKNFKNTLVLEENFNDNSNRWEIYNSEERKTSFENGRYIFQTNSDYCTYSTIPLKIKRNAIIKLKSTWLNGKNDFYGLKLEEAGRKYYVFELTPYGKTCFVKKHKEGTKHRFSNSGIGYFGYGKTLIEQTVILKGRYIEYYVNDKLIHIERSRRLSINRIGFSICKKQTVAFEKLQVWE